MCCTDNADILSMQLVPPTHATCILYDEPHEAYTLTDDPTRHLPVAGAQRPRLSPSSSVPWPVSVAASRYTDCHGEVTSRYTLHAARRTLTGMSRINEVATGGVGAPRSCRRSRTCKAIHQPVWGSTACLVSAVATVSQSWGEQKHL